MFELCCVPICSLLAAIALCQSIVMWWCDGGFGCHALAACIWIVEKWSSGLWRWSADRAWTEVAGAMQPCTSVIDSVIMREDFSAA